MRFASPRLLMPVHVAGAAVPAVLLVALSGRMWMPPATVHFWIVAGAAGVAAAASASLTAAGARRGDGRAVLLGTAFSTMCALLIVHGLATPGVLVGRNGLIAFAGGLALPVAVAVLVLTALPALRRPRRVGPLLALQAVLAASVLALGAVGLAFPSVVPAVPTAGSALAQVMLVAGLAGLGLLATRALRTHRLTQRGSDLTVALGCAWLAMALYTQLAMEAMSASFYIGHGLELGGVALIAVPAAFDLARGGASRPLVGDLAATELVSSEEAYLGPRVRTLVLRLTERDTSTAEHSRRVALLAARLGEELSLPAATRRQLAVGGLLHDIGKLSVPLEILRKPAALSEAEYAAVKRHPESGRRLLEELGGFSPTVRDLVGDHHERLDGQGYPRGLAGEDLPLHTRVLTVCDVYDALVSDRVYRPAWTPDRAFELLRAEAGTAFDERCVEALAKVLDVKLPAPGWVADVAPGHRAGRHGGPASSISR
jgi:HD-GYP domain-containing protein (c-di-GMP phosphodiesterase class II)